MTEGNKYDIDAIRNHIAKNHEPFCPSEEGPLIWVGSVSEASPHHGEGRLEVQSECQHCMKGQITVVPDKPEFHLCKQEGRKRHARIS